MTWKAFIRDDNYGFGVQLFVAKTYGRSEAYDTLLRPEGGFAFQRVEAGVIGPSVPFMDGDMAEEFLQAVLDAAWAHGLRPTGISGERGEIKRLEEHLGDMRAIAFHKVGAQRP